MSESNQTTGTLAVGFVTLIVFELFKNWIVDKGASLPPSNLLNCLVCLAVGILLVLPQVLLEEPKNPDMKAPTNCIITAYFIMALLYLISLLGLDPVGKTEINGVYNPGRVGYDSFSDTISSFFFVAAWFFFARLERDPVKVVQERLVMLILLILLLSSGALKAYLDLGMDIQSALLSEVDKMKHTLSAAAARQLLNLCNGAIFLGVYMLMVRLFSIRNPLTHLLILFFGCAQILADARDCLDCKPFALMLEAYVVGWILVIGKLAFGLYVHECYRADKSPA
jgi:hypothetical protein